MEDIAKEIGDISEAIGDIPEELGTLLGGLGTPLRGLGTSLGRLATSLRMLGIAGGVGDISESTCVTRGGVGDIAKGVGDISDKLESDRSSESLKVTYKVWGHWGSGWWHLVGVGGTWGGAGDILGGAWGHL